LSDVVRLTPAATTSDITFDPLSWPGRKSMLLAEGGVHMILALPGDEFRLWLPGPDPPAVGTPLAAAVDFGVQMTERTAAAERFWRAMTGLPPRPTLFPLAPQPRRHAMVLWALDLRRAGQSQRAIARTMLNLIPQPEWADAAERSQIRRLLRDGDRLAEGGYLKLLQPPRHRVAMLA
jgi:hypothetical protein